MKSQWKSLIGCVSCLLAGRHPCHNLRRKNCLILALGVIVLLTFLHLSDVGDGLGEVSPLWPLGDVTSEARRLLELMANVQYECENTALALGNSSLWPVCVDRRAGLNLDGWGGLEDQHFQRISYTIGSRSDFLLEFALSQNYSYQVNIVIPPPIPGVLDLPPHIRHHSPHPPLNITISHSVIVPNDPSDFSRNSYGQQTINNLLGMGEGKGGGGERGRKRRRLDLLRLMSTSKEVELWQIVHFMIKDRLLDNVDMLHLQVYIDKMDEDYLYNWHRTLYEVFTLAGLRLYHVSSEDARCLHVTVMQSCIYLLAFLRPTASTFVLYPPANFGTETEERLRFFNLLRTTQSGTTASCQLNTLTDKTGGKDSMGTDVQLKNNVQHMRQQRDGSSRSRVQSWNLCTDRLSAPCNVIIFRFSSTNDRGGLVGVSHADPTNDLIALGCAVTTITQSSAKPRRHDVTSHSTHPEGGGLSEGTEGLREATGSGAVRNASARSTGNRVFPANTFFAIGHRPAKNDGGRTSGEAERRIMKGVGGDEQRVLMRVGWESVVRYMNHIEHTISLLAIDSDAHDSTVLRLLLDDNLLEVCNIASNA